jgi:hypothetical protein
MMKRIVLLTLVAAFLLACTTATTAKTPQNAVAIAIESRPDNAEVLVDGKFIGTTPLVHRMAPGEHKLTLVRDDFETWQRELSVFAENPSRVTAVLRKQVK